MSKLLKNNGLTLVLLGIFLATLVGQWLTGWRAENAELLRHGQHGMTLAEYSIDPEFLSAIFENWESEFLQMSAYVVLTGVLIQRGSAQSRDPDAPERDADPAKDAGKKDAPAVLKGSPLMRWLFAHSLGIALFLLFLLSFAFHWLESARKAAEEALQHRETPEPLAAYLVDPQFWFESFQNWQSEFLSAAVLVVLSIWLRQKESPESKAVAAPHSQTGS